MTKQVRDWQEDMEMCEKASPEPWSVDQLEYMGNRGMIQETVIDGVTSEIYNEEDARFISEARQALPYWLQEVKKLCEVNQQEQRKILGLRIRLNAEKERADQAEAREQMLREAIEEAIANINHEAFRTACNDLEDVLASLYTEEEAK